jgi:aminoglycoside phosphotransferase (APT) family kinase protein
MMYHFPPHVIGGLGGKDLEALSIPSEAEYVAAYCRRTGRQGIEGLNFYLAFNMFRFAAILHGIKGRIARGTAASAHAESMANNMRLIALLGWIQAEKN